MERGTKLSAQLISEDTESWKYIGNAFVNRNGSINLYLDDDVVIPKGAKIHLRVPRAKSKGGNTKTEVAA